MKDKYLVLLHCVPQHQDPGLCSGPGPALVNLKAAILSFEAFGLADDTVASWAKWALKEEGNKVVAAESLELGSDSCSEEDEATPL